MQKLVTAFVTNAPKLLKAGWELLWKLIDGIFEQSGKIGDAAGQIVGMLFSGLVNLGYKLGDAAYEIMEKFKAKIAEYKSMALTWGKDLILNFVNGIKNKIGAVVDAVKDVGNKVKDFLGFSEPEEGPLSNFHTYGPDMMELYAETIAKNKKLVQKAVEDVAGSVAPIFDLTPTLRQYDTGMLGFAPQLPAPADPARMSMAEKAARGGDTYHITVNVQQMSSDDDIRRTAERLMEEIARAKEANNSLQGVWS